MTPWLLVDYGEVISRPPERRIRDDLAARIGLEPQLLADRYWEHRAAFDAGLSSTEYWSAVADRELAQADVADLVAADRDSWAVLDPDMIDLLDELRADGVRLALLSNAPHWQADAFDELAWTSVFEQKFVSARLGLSKPDPAIFEHVLAELDVPAGDVTFVDDRQANVDGAASVGIRAIRFTGVADLRAALDFP
ncbi:HAD family hydrolase [Nocardioides mangrovicus]|uniref:HAD family hydrolase n=1 Tax=Nocardioides mangrovicus TaxID=2478913 RepID=UPI001314E989|nr:HAD family phosphatase [Nocardioides mangrovicus]